MGTEILRVMDISFLGILFLALLLLIIAVKSAVDSATIAKHLEERNNILKKQFRITEDVF